MSRLTPFLSCLALVWAVSFAVAQEPLQPGSDYEIKRDLLYREGPELTEAMKSRCRLDLYYPKNVDRFATVVWFHGGGLSSGEKQIPAGLLDKGLAVAAVNYRLHPEFKSPTYIEDAAAAVAWVLKHIEDFGGGADRVVVSGHSAGGYLTSMIGLDRRWLADFDVDADQLAGLAPLSGHTITHFTIRKERGLAAEKIVVDDMAPLSHLRDDAPPILLVTGDRELEMMGRYEENAYLERMLKVVGHGDTRLYELQGFNHGQMVTPAIPLVVQFTRRVTAVEQAKPGS